MEYIKPFLDAGSIIASDTLVFVAVQLALLALVLYAATIGKKHAAVKSAPQKLNPLVLAYSVLSASIIQAVSVTELVAGFKLVVTIADLGAAFYLCFANPWFRGLIIEVVTRGQKLNPEKPKKANA